MSIPQKANPYRPLRPLHWPCHRCLFWMTAVGCTCVLPALVQLQKLGVPLTTQDVLTDFQSFVLEYQETHQREPPPGMQDWHSFAVDNTCNLGQYGRIYRDLVQLQASKGKWLPGDISWESIDQADQLGSTCRIKIRGGKMLEHDAVNSEVHCVGLANILQRVLHFLPDLDFVVNKLDEPRVFRDLNQPAVQQLLVQSNKSSSVHQEAALGYQNPMHKTLTNVCIDPKEVERLSHLHGFYWRPASLPSSLQGNFPIFSSAKIDDWYVCPWAWQHIL